MDINYLYHLQQFRGGPGSLLTSFLSKMTWWGELNTVVLLIAAVYWCVNKEYGEYLFLGWSGNRLMNGFLKVTACVYRPWIRDARIVPDETAIVTATGYSFPSGHTMNAATVFGGSAIRREFGSCRHHDILLHTDLLCGVPVPAYLCISGKACRGSAGKCDVRRRTEQVTYA